MLVYERVVKDPVRLMYESEDDMAKHLNEVKLLNNENWKREKDEAGQITLHVPYYQMNSSNYVNPSIFKNVWEDNQKFMLERNLYNQKFFK